MKRRSDDQTVPLCTYDQHGGFELTDAAWAVAGIRLDEIAGGANGVCPNMSCGTPNAICGYLGTPEGNNLCAPLPIPYQLVVCVRYNTLCRPYQSMCLIVLDQNRLCLA